MRAGPFTAALLLASSFALVTMIASPSNAACTATSSLTEAAATCATDSQSDGHHAQAAEHDAVVLLTPACGVRTNGVCGRTLACPTSSGGRGVLYDVTIDGEDAGRQCIGDDEAANAAVVTPALAQREMRRIAWPASDLVIQPPDGLTLVNFDTNFYTTDTQPLTRSVTLLGQRITIEATPVEFSWHFGDGATLRTIEPGAAYPDLRITHNYTRKATYRPSLETTYAGRFRIGGGPWQEVPGTVTVAGPEHRLRAIEARPTPVGY